MVNKRSPKHSTKKDTEKMGETNDNDYERECFSSYRKKEDIIVTNPLVVEISNRSSGH